jgi:hypothetical protein
VESDELKRAVRILQAILDTYERDDGLLFAAEILAAAAFVAEQKRKRENLREFWNDLGAFRP